MSFLRVFKLPALGCKVRTLKKQAKDKGRMHTNTVFTYRPNPILNRSYLLFRKDGSGETPVGDYTVLDLSESAHVSELKVMNLVTQLNGRDDVAPVGEHTKSRLLFHVKPKIDETDPRTEVIFYTYTGKGSSRENAILTFEGVVQ